MQFPTSRWTDLANELGTTFAERAAEHDATDTFVADNYVDMKAKRVFSAGVPEELGGGGASVADLCAMLRALARHCSSTALALSMHTHLIASTTWRWRNQKAPVDALLKRVAAEQIVLVSTGGADWLLGSCSAVKVDGGYRVNGRKIFCSGVPAGDVMLTMAIEDTPEGPTVLHFALPTSAPGVKVHDNWRTLGMRATGSHDVTFDGVIVSDAAIAARRPSGKWHPSIHVVAMIALPIINAVYVGIAEAARDLALDAAKSKKNDRLVQVIAGEMENELTIAQLAVARMTELAMTAPPSERASMESLRCRNVLGRSTRATVDKAMELAGGGSFFRAAKLERLFRDMQGVRFHPMQDKPQSVLAGRHAFGMPLDD
jgi:acyl-CoA dehydrogenase